MADAGPNRASATHSDIGESAMQDLDAIMDSRPQGSEEPNEQQQREDGRDERGRFASQARQQAEQEASQTQQPQAQQQQNEQDKPPPGFIPQQAFDARLAKAEEKFNERYSALEGQYQQVMRQMQQFQQRPAQPAAPPAPPPDFFENPDAAFEARLQKAITPITQSQGQIVENFSRMMAADKFGEEIVNGAMNDLQQRVNQNPQGMHATYLRIMNSPHPYGELVRWHKEQSALKTYGDDPEAWRSAERERMKAELLAEMQGGGQQQQPAQQQAQAMPSSFAGARNNGPRAAVAFSGPKPLSEIMGGR
jgi:hypothetical protein